MIEVRVTERKVRRQKKGNVVYYACSRKELVDNPWERKFLAEKYHEGDIVRIKCLSLKEGHWFGEINGLRDIQVFAEYPSAARDFPIIPGMEYMGKIYHMNTHEHSLKVRVFQALTLERLSGDGGARRRGMPEAGNKKERPAREIVSMMGYKALFEYLPEMEISVPVSADSGRIIHANRIFAS